MFLCLGINSGWNPCIALSTSKGPIYCRKYLFPFGYKPLNRQRILSQFIFPSLLTLSSLIHPQPFSLKTITNISVYLLLEIYLLPHELLRHYILLEQVSPQHEWMVIFGDIIVFKTKLRQVNKNMSEAGSNKQVDLQAEWLKIYEKFAGPEESVGQGKEVELIQQWIRTAHPSQFQELQKQLQARGGQGCSLKSIITGVLNAEKESQFLIAQRYTLEKAQQLTDKVREKCKKVIQELENSQKQAEDDHTQSLREQAAAPSVEQPEQIEPNSPGKTSKVSNQFQQITKMASQPPVHLPSIRRNRGKVYNPQEMANYFNLSQDSIQEYNFKSPHMFQTKKKLQVSIKAKIFNNKFLKMAFQRFSKQAYNERGTFGQVQMSGDKMNLNKWMVFCKEFDFNQKFHIKHLIQIYQQSTQFGSTMNLEQFLMAVALLQQKYLDKFHNGQNFVEDVLKINSEAAFKVKMSNLKVQYGGPKRNFFEYSRLTQFQKKDMADRQKQWKKKKKQHQFVLINGMFAQSLKSEVQKRKDHRQLTRKSRGDMILNRSMVDPRKIDNNTTSLPHSPRSTNSDAKNYSKIFHIKQQTARKTTTNTSLTQSPANTTHMYKTQRKNDHKQPIIQAPEQSRTIYQSKTSKDQPKRQWITDSNNPSVWLTKIRTDSQQSDEILKEHMQLQKKIQEKRDTMKKSSWMQEMEQQSKKVSDFQQQIQEQQMAQTGANFNLKTRQENY